MNFQSFIRSRLATWVLGTILVFAMFGTAKIWTEQNRVNKEIARLEQQADKINQDNEQLSYLIEYFNTQEYKDKQAREKLNLKKEGEYVVGLPDQAELETQPIQPAPLSNPQLWFNYFFNHDAS